MADDPVHALLEQCCVQLRSAAGVGSGFFVAPKTVVTCAHVLGKGATVGSSAELRPGGRGEWLPARVTAIAPADEDDLAVLEVDAQVGTYPVLDADDDVTYDDELLIFGFPRFSPKEPQRAVLLPARYEATTGLTHLPDRVLHKLQSGRLVGGYSGSPALDVATGKVIGVISETIDPRAEAGGWAVRSTLLATLFPEVAAKNRNAASLQFWLDRIDTRQERREMRSRRLPRLPLTRYLERRGRVTEEIDYLDPYTLALPLVGRQHEREALWQWLNTERPISVAVWTGPVGSGKTRLALEAIDQAFAAGWHAGFLEGGDLERFRQQHIDWVWQRRTFVVVDNAATRAALLAAWFAELAKSAPGRPALRILLLERHADPESGWWQTVFQGGGFESRGVRDLLDPGTPVQLSQIIDTAEQRAILDGALEITGSSVRSPAPGRNMAFDEGLSLRNWTGEPLFLIMAALMASREKLGNVLSLRRTDLADKLAVLVERARIETIAQAYEIKPAFLVHMAAYVALCGGLTDDDILSAVTEERQALHHGADDTDTARVAEALQHALPSQSGGVAQITPDMLAEAFIITTFTLNRDDATVLRAAHRAPFDVLVTAIKIGQDYIDTNRLTDVQRWVRTIIRRADHSFSFLQRAYDAMPLSTLAFADEAAWIGEMVVLNLRIRTDNAVLPDLAMSLNNLGIRFAALGQREAALKVTQEAVAIRRELAASRPDASRPDLAMSLNNLGNRFDALGQREAALKVTQEAVAIYRELAASRPDASRPDLAMSLNNLGNRFDALGQREAALKVTQEAVAIYRELAASRPDASRPDLAMSLNNLGIRFTALGQREAALKVTQEAVAIRRELAASRPDAFRPDLAGSLNNLGIRFAALGQREAALKVTQEAVAIRRELAASRPDAFRPDLAGSLNNLGIRFAALGQREAALKVTQEAVAIRRELAASRPDAFRPDLAGSLNNLGVRFAALGQREAALKVAQEAVAIRRELAASRPDAFRPDLATSLKNLGIILDALGRHEEASRAMEEAAAIQSDKGI